MVLRLLLILATLAAAPTVFSQEWEPKPLPPAEDDHPEEHIPESLETHPDVPEDFDGYSERWTGAYLGAGLFGGTAIMGNDSLSNDLAWGLGVKARISMVNNLFHVQLDYRFGQFAGHLDKTTAITLDHNAVGLSVAFHPLFLTNLGGNRFFYTLASIYLEVGASLNHVSMAIPAQNIEESDLGYGVILGTGFDVPITDPDASGALWLGTAYRWQGSLVDLGPFARDDELMSEHLFWLRAAYRHNGLVF